MRQKTDKEFNIEVQNLVGNSYIFLEPYKGTNTKIQYYHVDCAKIHSISPNNFLSGQRCPSHRYNVISNKNKNKYNTQTFKLKIKNLVGNEYTLLSNYVNAKTKVEIKHNKCGNIYKVTPSDFSGGKRCPKCAIINRSNKRRKTQKQFVQEVNKLGNNEYLVVGKYVNWKTPVELKHLKCNKIIKMAPSSFLRGSRCTCSKNYSGENLISKILNDLGIKYTKEQKFEWLRYKKPQHLDFYIPDYNLAIEYDGEQHSNPKRKWYSKEIVARDKNKDKLCKLHNIKLIRISYKYDTYNTIKHYMIEQFRKAGILIPKDKNMI